MSKFIENGFELFPSYYSDDIIYNECVQNKCFKKIPKYNYIGKKVGLFCNDHKQKGMSEITYKKCVKNGCSKCPRYDYFKGKTSIFCHYHTKSIIYKN